MTPYADTSFFTRYYLEMAESAVVRALAEKAERRRAPPLPVTWLHRMELCNALQLHVFQSRGPAQKRVALEQVAASLAVFRDELGRQALLRPVALAPADLEQRFEELSLRHTARHGLRTYDLLHIASALLLNCDTFWSFDPKANMLAALEGLETVTGGGRR
jgi:predicted nucleic acid-binding protein